MSLVYYPDSKPGLARRKRGRGFSYHQADGRLIEDADEISRLKSLAVPPAYTDVWLSPLANSHLQATGRDAKHRKQYRYHPQWRSIRDTRKFDRLIQVGESLPALRRWITSRLAGEVGEFETAVAAVLALLDRGSMRPGHTTYTVANSSHGATTLKPRHLTLDGDCVELSYTAKGGRQVTKRIQGRSLQRVLHRSQDLPGPALITWINAQGEASAVRSEHLQEILLTICGNGVTAKSLRTWNGSHAAMLAALESEELNVSTMAESAAKRLHNTAAISRKSYIHPEVISLAELARDDRLERLSQLRVKSRDGLRKGEAELIALLCA